MLSYLEASHLLQIPLEFPDSKVSLRSFSIDTRTLQEGELFVSLKGKNSDGHEHIALAYEKGASGALIDVKKKDEVMGRLQKTSVKVRNVLAVEDPEQAMTALAASYRSTLKTRTIGVVGSVGKTTTKEFLYFLLHQNYPAIATSGNLNNHLGVPIMLSRLRPEHRFAVLELGANHPGEIASLSELIKPSGVILTPIGPAHLEGFGSLENVYKAKTEIVDFLAPDAPLVIPGQDGRLCDILKKKNRKFITVGFTKESDFHISNVVVAGAAVQFTLNGKWRFSFPGQATFLALNAALAIAMAAQWGISIEKMPCDWEEVSFASGRFRETILPNGLCVIDDSYNASPLAFTQALDAFERIPGKGKKILVFADMLELGDDEVRFHRELGEKISKVRIDAAFAYGERSREAVDAILSDSKRSCEARHFSSSNELAEYLKDLVRPGDLVLLKGSRSMHVEKVLARLNELTFSIS